jgi:isopentenyldiphosphate isomerase
VADEKVDVLTLPFFEKNGVIKSRRRAIEEKDWLATFNLWILKRYPRESVIYQVRGPKKKWAPGRLDVTVSGHLKSGEESVDGLREVREEIGREYEKKRLIPLGRKIYIGLDVEGNERRNIDYLYFVEDNSPISEYNIDEEEVYALCECPLEGLLKVFDEDYSFSAWGVRANGEGYDIEVSKDSFTESWDSSHYKIILLAKRYFQGEKNLIY